MKSFLEMLVEQCLETTSVGLFGFCQSLKPVSDFAKTFFARGACESGVHVGVLVGFASNGCFQVVFGATNGQTGGGVTNFTDVIQVSVSVARFTFAAGFAIVSSFCFF